MGRGRKSSGGWAGPIGQIWLQKKEEQEKRRAIQDAGSAEERERIEAAQEGREAFADSGRWGHLDKHGRTIPEPAPTPAPPPVQRLQIQDPPKPTPTKTTTKKKKATPKTTAPTSAVSGSLGSTSGGTVNL